MICFFLWLFFIISLSLSIFLFFPSSLIFLSFAVCYHTPGGVCAALCIIQRNVQRSICINSFVLLSPNSRVYMLRLCHPYIYIYIDMLFDCVRTRFKNTEKKDETKEREREKNAQSSCMRGPRIGLSNFHKHYDRIGIPFPKTCAERLSQMHEHFR